MPKDKSPVEAMMEMEDLSRSLKEMKMPMDDLALVTKVVTALREEIDMFKTAWESIPESDQTRERLMAALKREEVKKKARAEKSSGDTETARAFHSSGGQQRTGNKKGNGDKGKKKTVECFNCGGPHFKRDCPERKTRDTSPRDHRRYDRRDRDESPRNDRRSDRREDRDSRRQDGHGESRRQDGHGESRRQEGRGESRRQEGRGDSRRQEGRGDSRRQEGRGG